MGKIRVSLTVYFEEPFWVGVFEKVERGKVSASRIVFGAEPKDLEVYSYVLQNYCSLRFSPAVATVVKDAGRNPKRLQREAHKQTLSKGIGTRSQQAIKEQQEQNKLARKERSREQKEASKERAFELKQQKKLQKRRGH